MGLPMLALAMSTPACLVTSTPEFEQPRQTPPFLITSTASPDPTQIYVVDNAKLATQQNAVTFSADVRSDDNGESVEFQLYIDYGWPGNQLGQPFRMHIPDIAPLEPSTMSDTSRRVTAKWFPTSPDFGLGCHTVTLIASHRFDKSSTTYSGCPACLNDSSQITCQIYRCDSDNNFSCDDPSFAKCLDWGTEFRCTNPESDAGISCGDKQ